jgi:hypothetical protein
VEFQKLKVVLAKPFGRLGEFLRDRTTQGVALGFDALDF